jgi:hypothetical protein
VSWRGLYMGRNSCGRRIFYRSRRVVIFHWCFLGDVVVRFGWVVIRVCMLISFLDYSEPLHSTS